MQCLYCGERIGPIRQFLDPEFCSEEHRAQAREIYRQQFCEALADTGSLAPTALRALPKSLPWERLPVMKVEAAGVSIQRAAVFGPRSPVMPTRLALRIQPSRSPSVIASQTQPLKAGPLLMHCDLKTALDKGLPVAFGVPKTRNFKIILPTPPAAPASPIGALAGRVQPASSPVPEAAGYRIPPSAMAAWLERIPAPAVPHKWSRLPVDALLGEIGCAPLSQTVAPAPAEAADGLGLALRANVRHDVRSGAVLWNLRVTHLCIPVFQMDPVRVPFNDLVSMYRSMASPPDLEEQGPVKTNLRFFKRAPKWQYIGAAAAALLLAGALHPQVAPQGFGQSLRWRETSIRQWMSQRATRTFADDFRAGLNQWKGVQKKWPNSWSYSTDGFIHPGQLALYRPSVPLSDYRLEFMAQIENKSVDWVVRAQDAHNYYAVKFTVVKPGPRPLVAMVRYAVIGGHKGARVQTPLRMMIHANTPYRVTVDVKGNRYRAYIDGQEADFWTEDKLKIGGVGFFSDAGERARVYWVKLESHNDILGRICGVLSGNSSEGATHTETQAMHSRHAGTMYMNAVSGPGGAKAAIITARKTRVYRSCWPLFLSFT